MLTHRKCNGSALIKQAVPVKHPVGVKIIFVVILHR